MVSYLILAFGLLCAGAAADSWNFAEDYNKRGSYEEHWTGFIPMDSLCNECLRTVTDMTRMSNGKIEMKTCRNFKAKKNEICKKVVNGMRENEQRNLLDGRGLCAKVKYCTEKNRIVAELRPLFVSSSNNRDWSDELEKKRCRAGRNDHDGEPEETILDLAHRDSKCRECAAVIKQIKHYIEDVEPKKFMLPMACSQIQGPLSNRCFKIIQKHSDDLIQYLTDKKSNFQICSAIEECHRKPGTGIGCDTCVNYITYVKAVGFEDDVMVRWACKDSMATDKQQCIQGLEKGKSRILDIYYQKKDEDSLEICHMAKICSILLLPKPVI